MSDTQAKSASSAAEVMLSDEEKKLCVDGQKFMFDTLYADKMRDSPLKPIGAAIEEKMAVIKKQVETIFVDIHKGKSLLVSCLNKDEIERFDRFVEKSKSPVDLEDIKGQENTAAELEFLLEQVKKKVVEGKYEESALMYRYLLQLYIGCGMAWVGLAVCEQLMGHDDAAEGVYSLALTILPDDVYIVDYAAHFFMKIGKIEEAKEILRSALEKLTAEGMEGSDVFKRFSELLASE